MSSAAVVIGALRVKFKSAYKISYFHYITHKSGEPGLVDRVLALHAGSRGFDSHRGHMSEQFFRSNRPGYPQPVSSELENSGIRVAVGDCSVTERRRWRPPYQTGKTVHVHAKHYKHDEDGRTAPGVCGNGSVSLSHSGNVVTRIGIHTHTYYPQKTLLLQNKKTLKILTINDSEFWVLVSYVISANISCHVPNSTVNFFDIIIGIILVMVNYVFQGAFVLCKSDARRRNLEKNAIFIYICNLFILYLFSYKTGFFSLSRMTKNN